MADDIQAKRAFVTNAYPKKKNWANKVKHMSDIQVTAIYLRMKAEGVEPLPEKEFKDEIPF